MFNPESKYASSACAQVGVCYRCLSSDEKKVSAINPEAETVTNTAIVQVLIGSCTRQSMHLKDPGFGSAALHYILSGPSSPCLLKALLSSKYA